MRWFWAIVVVAGCGQSSGTPGRNDLSMSTTHDLSATRDMTAPAMCAAVDPMSDGQACGTGCPAGTIAVGSGSACHCWMTCDPAQPTECPCDRRCAMLTRGDMGVVGGGCLLANGPGERCGVTGDTGPNGLGCAQDLICVNADDAGMFRYCVYPCQKDADCPIQTGCLQLNNSTQKACAYLEAPQGLAPGATCTPATQGCQTGYLCDGICRQQCDRAGATCASGTCQPLTDQGRVVGYICK
jgi:hypothetical protein